MQLSRHTLVWIQPESRGAVAAQVSDAMMHTQVAAWLVADRPLVTARQPCGLSQTTNLSVGLTLSPALGKRRVALVLATNDIARYAPPLRLDYALSHAPAGWQTALAELDAAAMDAGIELRVFGSLAWQALSGLQYVTPQSDIDLLWHPRSRRQLQQGIALLASWEQSSGLRADGEVLFGGSHAVSWREWATLKPAGDQRVLVKRTSSAELVAANDLLELLA